MGGGASCKQGVRGAEADHDLTGLSGAHADEAGWVVAGESDDWDIGSESEALLEIGAKRADLLGVGDDWGEFLPEPGGGGVEQFRMPVKIS